MGSVNYLQAIRPDTAFIRKIIESSLLSDWAIRIEFHGPESESNCWQLWAKTFFAVRSAEPVLQAMLNCYSKHPNFSIRLSAERYHPQSRMLYKVYEPPLTTPETDDALQTSVKRIRAGHEATNTQYGQTA